jgi:CBS-domain-containing membrane protein
MHPPAGKLYMQNGHNSRFLMIFFLFFPFLPPVCSPFLVLGATAVLASLNPEIRQMGWYYLPVILLTSTLALVVALIVNNIHRRFPVFWIKHTPPPLTKSTTPTPIETLTDVEKMDTKAGGTVTEIPV